MKFDFKKAFEDAKKDLSNNRLFLLLLGPSGNGKSYVQGTFGCRVLYLYTKGEDHGPKAAREAATRLAAGTEIMPLRLDLDNDKELTSDETLKRLHSILEDSESIKLAKIGAVVLDSMTEIEHLIRSSSHFKQMTTTDSGKHNGFAEAGATLFQFKEIIAKLKKLQRDADVHICATEILTVKELSDEGLILDSTPQLIGYTVATGIVQQFEDVVIMGKMSKKDKIAYRFQMVAESSKVSKDSVTREIKKTFNFSPRLTGVDILNLPPTLDANLAELAKLKAGDTK